MGSWEPMTKKLDAFSSILQCKCYFVLDLLERGIVGPKSRLETNNLAVSLIIIVIFNFSRLQKFPYDFTLFFFLSWGYANMFRWWLDCLYGDEVLSFVFVDVCCYEQEVPNQTTAWWMFRRKKKRIFRVCLIKKKLKMIETLLMFMTSWKKIWVIW